jgi:hypothetical protein
MAHRLSNTRLNIMPIDKTQPFSTLRDFLIETSLYVDVSLANLTPEEIYKVTATRQRVDSYCPYCKKESTFNVSSNATSTVDYEKYAKTSRRIEMHATCSREDYHYLRFFITMGGHKLSKVGQDPSYADLALPELKKYAKELGNPLYREYSKAVGLFAHGVGIGSFVYLRRIFETLVAEAEREAIAKGTTTTEALEGLRMHDRVRILSAHLPEMLVENSILYSVLSKGIHELTEEQCAAAFPAARAAIELVLDERMREAARQAQIAKTKAEVQQAAQAIASISTQGDE